VKEVIMPVLRDAKKEAFWRRMVRGQGRSGLTVREWCRQRGLGEATFYRWRAELARRDAGPASGGEFVPVRVVQDWPVQVDSPRPGDEEPASGQGRIEIVLPGGRRVRVDGRVDRVMLSDVLAVLMSGSGESEGQAC
jgi:transposase-like protein